MSFEASPHRPNTASRGRGWVIVQFTLFAAIACAPRRIAGLPAWPARVTRPSQVIGLIFVIIGIATRIISLRWLGSNRTFAPRPRDQAQLIQNGPYSVVRHPIYSGMTVLAFGWSLLRQSTPGIFLSIALGIFFDLKSRREEAWLLQRFPEYAEYRRRVSKLIPWIY